MTILVIDDHELVREGLKLLLEDVDLCGKVLTASTGTEALERLDGKGVDLVLLDLNLGQESGLDVLAKIRKLDADLPVIVLSVSESAGVVREAIKGGANGYIVKSVSRDLLVQSLNLAITGQQVALLPLNCIAESAPRGYGTSSPLDGSADVRGVHSKLTEQEARVLGFVRQGMSNKETARALGIIEGTVKVHVKSIFRKLGAKNRTIAALMAAAAEQGDAGRPGESIAPDRQVSSAVPR